MIHWEAMTKISSSKIAASTGLWVFITPMLVKFFQMVSLENPIVNLELSISPNIFLLYFSALCFFSSCVVCKLFCPQVILITDSFSDFNRKGMSFFNIQEFIDSATKKVANEINGAMELTLEAPSSSEISNNEIYCIEINCIETNRNIKIAELDKTYWLTRKAQNKQNLVALYICFILNLLAVSLLLLILLKNLAMIITFIF